MKISGLFGCFFVYFIVASQNTSPVNGKTYLAKIEGDGDIEKDVLDCKTALNGTPCKKRCDDMDCFLKERKKLNVRFKKCLPAIVFDCETASNGTPCKNKCEGEGCSDVLEQRKKCTVGIRHVQTDRPMLWIMMMKQ
eukprot:TRINITY_DN12497_c0_g1_i1.p1 TRINITY_DN12497_c0_g1~~TRINITY_DN12497_c0_g1_i1.p1  ORF type:complete len:137 (-),score=22.32 TRINITY_DN12497_c0_g1_i1:147-557(-)